MMRILLFIMIDDDEVILLFSFSPLIQSFFCYLFIQIEERIDVKSGKDNSNLTLFCISHNSGTESYDFI